MTSTTFTGQVGHTYGFYSVATDPLGFTQPTPRSAQALTTVTSAPAPTSNAAECRERPVLNVTVDHGSRQASEEDLQVRRLRAGLQRSPQPRAL